jgi:hypothetical protein
VRDSRRWSPPPAPHRLSCSLTQEGLDIRLRRRVVAVRIDSDPIDPDVSESESLPAMPAAPRLSSTPPPTLSAGRSFQTALTSTFCPPCLPTALERPGDEADCGGLPAPHNDFVGNVPCCGEAGPAGERAYTFLGSKAGMAGVEASSLVAVPGPGAGCSIDSPVRLAELWPHAEGGVWLDCPARRPWALQTARPSPARARTAGCPKTGAAGDGGRSGPSVRRRCRVEWVKSVDSVSGDGGDCGDGGNGGGDDEGGTEEADYVVITLPVQIENLY